MKLKSLLTVRGCAWRELIFLFCCLGSVNASQLTFAPGNIPGFPDIPDIPGGIPPILISSSPASGANNVAINTPVSFTFLVAMDAAYAVAWSSNLSPDKFSYSWSADSKTLTATYGGDLPSNATITWTLDPTVFKDKSGVALLSVNNSGSFTTGSGQSNPNDPCNGGSTNSNNGSLSMSKTIHYLQTSAAPPVIDPDSGAVFAASAVSPKSNPFTEATVVLPNGTTKSLPNLFGTFFLVEEFATEAALEAAYPSGTYAISVKQATGASTVTFQIGAAGTLPVPQLSNYPQTQAYDASKDFTLQWLPYSGATANDSIFLNLNDDAGNSFAAPDPCVPRLLSNTATSIVVPANTFAAGGTIQGFLSFSKTSGFDTNSIENVIAYASYSKTTDFELKPSGGTQQQPPEIQSFVRLPNGTVQFQVKAQAGANILVETSSDLSEWTPIANGPAVGGILSVIDPAASTLSQRYYRAKTL